MKICSLPTSTRAFLLLALFIFLTAFSFRWKHPSFTYHPNREIQIARDTVPDTARNVIADKVEIEASVDVHEWRSHLEKELVPVIEKAAAKKMHPGQYVVNIRFLVERDGSISDVKALNDPGYGLAKGAERVVKGGPKWMPGMVNGKVVRSYHTQPITFVISP
jgi:hypothetical protein